MSASPLSRLLPKPSIDEMFEEAATTAPKPLVDQEATLKRMVERQKELKKLNEVEEEPKLRKKDMDCFTRLKIRIFNGIKKRGRMTLRHIDTSFCWKSTSEMRSKVIRKLISEGLVRNNNNTIEVV